MASFVEQATLQVRDQSTPQIKQINSALKQLQSTARSMKSINIKMTGLTKAASDAARLKRELTAIKSVTASIKVNTTGITQAQRHLNQLRASAARPITISTRAGHMARTPVGMGGGFAGAAARGAARGAGVGGGSLGFYGITPQFYAVAAAAELAAKALTQLATGAGERSRSKLGLNVAATPEQAAIINAQAKQPGTMPLNVTENTFRDLARSLLGDVGGDTPAEKATAASNLARTLLRDVLPVSYALAPAGTTLEQAGQDLAAAAKAVNIASSDFTDASGNLTAEGKRAFEGIMLGKYIAPEVPFSAMRTTLAGMKSQAASYTSEAIARVIAESADFGQRVGNEAYQMVEAFSGTLDNKRLNNALDKAGMFESVTRNKKGNITGGVVKDAALLESNAPAWWAVHGKEFTKNQVLADKQVQKAGEQRVAALLKEKPDATQEAIAKAREPTQTETNAVLRTLFPSLRGTARNAMTRSMFGEKQWERQLAQGKSVAGQDLQKIYDQSLIGQFENVRTTLINARDNMGETASDFVGLTQILKDIDNAIKNPRGPEAKKLTQQGIELAQYTNPMFVAGKLLTKGGEKLLDAASALYDWIPKKEKTPAEQAAAAAKAAEAKAREKAETDQIVIGARRDTIERGIADLKLQQARAQKRVDEARTPQQRDRAQRDLDRINLKLAPVQAAINSLTAQLTSLAVTLGQVKLPDWAKQPEKLVKPPAEGDKKWGDTKPSSMTDIATAAATMDSATSSWLSSITPMTAIPNRFDEVFQSLPPKASEAGTNFSLTAMTGVKDGAADAGSAFANAAVAGIKAGVSGLNISVNANVTGAKNSTADKGGSTPD